MRITFLGAASEVTGSCYLVEAEGLRFLVDCGMFQGGRDAERKNLEALRLDLSTLSFVMITHAHLDHCGLLPRLAALGYKQRVIATRPTVDLMAVMLKDSAHIQEKEAAWQNRRRHQHEKLVQRDVAPLYTVAQAEECMRLADGVEYERTFSPHKGVQVRFRDAGHILGSAIIEIWVEEFGRTTKLVFSGDLGQPSRPIMRNPAAIEDADLLMVESTYGNRLHKGMTETLDELVEVLDTTLKRHAGNVIVPAFALGRTQDLLVILADLAREGRVSNLHVFVDSPLAQRATEITLKYARLLSESGRELAHTGKEHGVGFEVRFTETLEDSMALNSIRSGAVIIAGSGMCDGGRIKHHLRYNLQREECAILFTGFQAQGTLGRRIVDGARSVQIFGEPVAVRAKVYTLGGLSAHADRDTLLEWLGHFKRAPRTVCVMHGEKATAEMFAQTVRDKFRWNVAVPERGQTIEI
jgi:metallo-beta-lactamase family protein